MKDAPAFDFYPERFWFAVEGWPDADVLRYFRLLSQQWMRDGLPADERELAGLARGKVSDRVLEKFPIAADGRRRNAFLEDIRSGQRERIAKRRDGAAKTNAKRWGSESLDDRSASRPASRSANRSTTIERVASESPPPTTHHPPLPPNPPGGGLAHACEPAREPAREAGEPPCGSPPSSGIPPATAEQCAAQSRVLGVLPEVATAYWHDRNAVGWVSAKGIPIRNWHSDLKAFASRWASVQAERTARNGPRPTPAATQPTNRPTHDGKGI